METAGIQTGMALMEQDGEETDNYDDLMQVQRALYRQGRDSPNLISIILSESMQPFVSTFLHFHEGIHSDLYFELID